jgi:hypothetical protein
LDLHLAIVCGDRAPIIPELCAHTLPFLGEEIELLNADNLLIHSARSGLGLGLSCCTKTTRKFMMWVAGFRDCASALEPWGVAEEHTLLWAELSSHLGITVLDVVCEALDLLRCQATLLPATKAPIISVLGGQSCHPLSKNMTIIGSTG